MKAAPALGLAALVDDGDVALEFAEAAAVPLAEGAEAGAGESEVNAADTSEDER